MIGYVSSSSSAPIASLTSLLTLHVELSDACQIHIIHSSTWNVELAKTIGDSKSSFPNVPILVLLDQIDDNAAINAYQAGANECLSSYANPSLFESKCAQLAAKSELLHQLADKQEQFDDVLTRIRQEESFAQHVYEEITGGALNHDKDYFSVQHSASGFCGDFLFEMVSPTGIRYVFLADAMGHGLAAALSILPVIHVVKAMAHRSMPITTIVHEVNRRLNIELPDDRFVSLAALEISPFSHMVSVVNAGLPDLFVATKDGELKACSSQCIPLGIAQGAAFSFEPYTFDLDSLASLLMYTDGLIEQENTQSECISKQGLEASLKAYMQSETPWQNIALMFDEHRGDVPLSDDVTVCAIDFEQFVLGDPDVDHEADSRNGKIAFSMDITGDYLKCVDVPAFVSKFLYASDIEGKIAGKTFTAIAELYQNGLDHGVLELNSDLKNDIEGFADYMAQREERLAKLTEKDKVTIELSYQSATGLTAEITDSGTGYDVQKINPDQFSLHGRGLALVRQLSESFATNSSGNKVSIVMKE